MADEKKEEKVDTSVKQTISIDFGSFGSTASFCMASSPSKYIVLKNWGGMSTCDTAMQKKTLTALLWDDYKKEVVSFGYQAQTSYFNYCKIMKGKKKSVEEKKAALRKKFKTDTIYNKWAFFKHFKPHLVGDDPLRKDKFIYSTDKSAKLSIFDLVTYSLIEIKNQAMKELIAFRKDLHFEELKEDEILWALSTPTVWDDTSRGAFKECAINAGMEHHIIGLEPEFALFCMTKADAATFLSKDKKYIILDCGGSTVDATCVEIIGGGAKMEETLPRDGIDIGSLDIDKEYYKMLEGVFGSEFINEFRYEEQPHHWNGVETSFWKAKHVVDIEKFGDSGLHVDVPRAFWKKLESKFKADDDEKEDEFEKYVTEMFKKYCKNKYGEDNVKYIEYEEEDDSINIQIPVWHDFHKNVLDNICTFVENLLSADNMDDCQNVVLVGGLSQSKFLQQRLIDRFGDVVDEYDDRKITFNSAAQPSWAVTIGGLFWAYNRKNFQRKMWLTYGFQVNCPWNPIKDAKIKKHRDMNSPTGYIKKNVFDLLICKNDLFDEHQRETREYIIPFNAGILTLNLYCIDSPKGAYFTTDKGCKVAATYELKLKDEKWVKLVQQKLPITVEFEETMFRILITRPDYRQYEMIIKNPKIKKLNF